MGLTAGRRGMPIRESKLLVMLQAVRDADSDRGAARAARISIDWLMDMKRIGAEEEDRIDDGEEPSTDERTLRFHAIYLRYVEASNEAIKECFDVIKNKGLRSDDPKIAVDTAFKILRRKLPDEWGDETRKIEVTNNVTIRVEPLPPNRIAEILPRAVEDYGSTLLAETVGDEIRETLLEIVNEIEEAEYEDEDEDEDGDE